MTLPEIAPKPKTRAEKLEFRFSISPSPSFYSTVRLAALSLRRLGSPYDTARLVVSVGDYATLDQIRTANAWSEDFPVEWRTVDAEAFRDQSYLATHNDRYFAPAADVIAHIGEPGPRKMAGLQAHFSPFFCVSAEQRESEWRRIFAAADLGEPPLSIAYSGDRDGAMGRAPAYFNYGLVALSRAAFDAIAPAQASCCNMMHRLTNGSFFLTQIALSVSSVAEGVEAELLSFAYNCSNDELPFAAPDRFRINCVEEIRVIHYLRGDEIDRRAFLVDPAAYAAFMSATNLNRVNERLRNHLATLAQYDDLLFR